jgi:HSP20 family molecular chaperone IbpA
MARIEKSIEVNAPLRAVYNQWTQFEDFPRFMEGVVKVRQLDDTHLRWRANVAGKDKEWDAEIVEQVPDRRIAWRSVGGARNEGTVEFRSVAPDRTLVWLTMDYEPDGLVENVGDALGLMSRRVQGDLERFREFIEARGRPTGAWRGEVHGSGEMPGREHDRDAWPEPFERLRRMTREMDMVFDRLMGTRPRAAESRTGTQQPASGMQDLWTPRIEVTQHGDEMVVRADLPGTKREDVHVEVDEGRLVIQGERRCSTEHTEAGVHRSECTYGRFFREIALPHGADTDAADASMRDGVLEIRLRVPSRRQGRRLDIRGGQEGAMEQQGGLTAAPAQESAGASQGGARTDGGPGDWHLGR